MDNTHINDAYRRLGDLKKKLEHLRFNEDLFSPADRFSMTHEIKKNVIEDAVITEFGMQDNEFSNEIKGFINEATTYQKAIISEATKHEPWNSELSNATVKDFDSAKQDLINLVRDELSGIDAIDSSEQDFLQEYIDIRKHKDTLRQVDSDCANERYQILLIGEFQSGKTTTLNALCGGHYMGAIGGGIATSAVPLSITYGEENFIYIEWKTAEQLKVHLANLCRHFEDFNLSSFDLDDATSRKYWLRRLDAYRHSKDAPKRHESQSRLLAICSIVLRYYGSAELQEFKSHSISPNETAAISKFPSELEKRWLESGVSSFTIDESIFVLAYRIHCHCNSKTLQKLNCTLVDCPGLFSNEFDTAVTEEAMSKAGAIIYVLPYHKQIGNQIDDSLTTIKRKYSDFHRKLILLSNLPLTGNKAFFEKNKEYADSLFESKVPIVPMDSLMAYFGAVKASVTNKTISAEEVSAFITRSNPEKSSFDETDPIPFDSFDEAWEYETTRYRVYYKRRDITEPDYLELSRFNVFVDELQTFIEKNKAYSIFYSNGINLLGKELSLFQNQIYLQLIEPCTLEDNERIALWNNRINLAETINDELTQIAESELLDINFTETLASYTYQKLFSPDVLDEMLRDVCVAVYSDKKKLFKLRNDESQLQSELKPIIRRVVSNTIEDRFKYWNMLVESEQDLNLTIKLNSQVGRLRKRTRTRWEVVFETDQRFKQAMPDFISFPKGTKKLTMFKREEDAHVSLKSKDLAGAILGKIGEVTAAIAALLGAYISAIMLGFGTGVVIASNPIGWIIALIGLGAGGAWLLIEGDDAIQNAFVKKIQPDIKKQFEKQSFDSKLKAIIKDELRKSLKGLCEDITVDMNRMNRERVMATSAPEELREKNCAKGLDTYSRITEELSTYQEYVNNHLEYD